MRWKMKALGSVDVPVHTCLSAQAALLASVEWGRMEGQLYSCRASRNTTVPKAADPDGISSNSLHLLTHPCLPLLPFRGSV